MERESGVLVRLVHDWGGWDEKMGFSWKRLRGMDHVG